MRTTRPRGSRDAVKEVHTLADSFPDVSRARAIQVASNVPASHVHLAGGVGRAWRRSGSRHPGHLATLPCGRNPCRLGSTWLAGWPRGKNPLSARVAVNRIWQEYFGAGLVATSDNFGLRGETPSHPESARLACHGVHRFGLEPQACPPPDRDLGDLPPGFSLAGGPGRAGSGEPPARPASPAARCQRRRSGTRRWPYPACWIPRSGGRVSVRTSRPAWRNSAMAVP